MGPLTDKQLSSISAHASMITSQRHSFIVIHGFRSTMKSLVIPWYIICLTSSTRTGNANDREYEMKFSIPQCGIVSQAVFRIIQLLNSTSICEVVGDDQFKLSYDNVLIEEVILFMGRKWDFTYVGCSEKLQDTLNGTIYIYFFVERINTNVDDRCLKNSAKKFSHVFKNDMKILGTIDSKVFEIKDLNVDHLSELQCPSNDIHDHEVQGMNKSLKSTGQQVVIPRTDDYSPITTIPINSTEVHGFTSFDKSNRSMILIHMYMFIVFNT
ncbi:hypothetical protein D915_010651 [Fasciola hepatica]|uniref:Uncharacterized protein n=1 Tax=Fasciola hepatica TaxID=6192 RepID=A0A4E0QYU8_FASHE|nr:hypothetical protein D915_010651 [Fasciola hepatica]